MLILQKMGSLNMYLEKNLNRTSTFLTKIFPSLPYNISVRMKFKNGEGILVRLFPLYT